MFNQIKNRLNGNRALRQINKKIKEIGKNREKEKIKEIGKNKIERKIK